MPKNEKYDIIHKVLLRDKTGAIKAIETYQKKDIIHLIIDPAGGNRYFRNGKKIEKPVYDHLIEQGLTLKFKIKICRSSNEI